MLLRRACPKHGLPLREDVMKDVMLCPAGHKCREHKVIKEDGSLFWESFKRRRDLSREEREEVRLSRVHRTPVRGRSRWIHRSTSPEREELVREFFLTLPERWCRVVGPGREEERD